MRGNSHFRHGSNGCQRPSGERGYILLVLALFTALLVIGFARILPPAVFEGQRDKEEEAIFRGRQYQHAIQLFVRKFGRYPNTLEELENTNNVRFLRRRYRDPLTKEGEWRLIHIGPGGVFTDSLTAAQPGGLSSPSKATTGLEPSPEMYRPESASGETSTSGTPRSPSFTQTNAPGIARATGESGEPALRPSANPAANPQQQPRAAASAQGGAQPLVFGGEGIAGVASQNTASSIKVWNKYSHYNEWEFIYDFHSDPLGMAAVTRATGSQAQPAGQRPSAPGQPPTAPQLTPTMQNPPTQFLGGPPPGVRPAFPTSPIPPGTSPVPRQR